MFMRPARIGRRLPVALAPLAAGLALAVAGCGGSVPLLKPAPPTDRLVLIASKTLNACDPPRKPVSHSVVVRVYALKTVDAFQELKFEAIWDEQAIEADLAAPTKEFVLAPGAAPLSLELPRPEGATAIGVAAAFCRLDPGYWRKTVALDKHAASLKFMLEETRLEMAP